MFLIYTDNLINYSLGQSSSEFKIGCFEYFTRKVLRKHSDWSAWLWIAFWKVWFQRSVLGVHWNDWCWGWNSNTLATWCKELTHWKRPWCWERLRGGREGDDRGWDGWMASSTRWTWVWVDFGSWWWTGRPGVLQFIRSQRVGHNWATELNWTDFKVNIWFSHFSPVLLILYYIGSISLLRKAEI